MDGVGLALVMGVAAGAIMASNLMDHGQVDLLAECQKDLPRSQQCVLVAVPEVANDMPNMQER